MELDPTGPLILKLFGASPVLPSTISTAIPTRFSHVLSNVDQCGIVTQEVLRESRDVEVLEAMMTMWGRKRGREDNDNEVSDNTNHITSNSLYDEKPKGDVKRQKVKTEIQQPTQELWRTTIPWGVFPKRVIPPQPTPTPPPSSLISTPNPTLTTDICTSILHVFQSDDKEGWEALVDTWMGLPPHVDVEVFKELDDMALESILDYIITPPRTPTAHLGTLLIPKLLTPTRHHQTRLLSLIATHTTSVLRYILKPLLMLRPPKHCYEVTVKALRSVKGSGVAFLRECGRGEVVGWQGEMVGVLEVAVGEVGKKGEGVEDVVMFMKMVEVDARRSLKRFGTVVLGLCVAAVGYKEKISNGCVQMLREIAEDVHPSLKNAVMQAVKKLE